MKAFSWFSWIGGDHKFHFICPLVGYPLRLSYLNIKNKTFDSIKSVFADKDGIESLIFDEIDTGISGRTAQKVSEKMTALGASHQILCITHLPQIAAMADEHFVIEKVVKKDRSVTGIRRLTEVEIEDELARILGGVEITDAVRASAREMRQMAAGLKKYKKS